MPTDVLDSAALERLADAAVAELGSLSIWVSNAGGAADRNLRTLIDTPEDQWDNMIDLNLKAVWMGAKAACRHLPDGGAIINIASIAAFEAAPRNGPYAAAKAGVVNLTKTLAAELAPRRIRVNSVAPGIVPTEVYFEAWNVTEEQLPELESRERLGRFGTPEDMAAAVVYLAAASGAWVNGQTIVVSG